MKRLNLLTNQHEEVEVLHGHTSFDTAYISNDYPYGRLRCTMRWWIETVKDKGDRLVQQTVNPKTQRLNAEKKSNYYPLMFLYKDDLGHIHNGVLGSCELKNLKKNISEIIDDLGIDHFSDVQKNNIRSYVLSCIRSEAYFDQSKYTGDSNSEYINWIKLTLKYIFNCDFKDICKFPNPPHPNTIKEGLV